MENIVLALLGADASPQGWLWPVVIGAGNLPAKAPPGYRPMLPCPLWGDCWTREAVPGEADDDDAPVPGTDADQPDTRKRRAVRERDDGSKRDPFILNRFEKILAMAEMVNVDRPSDDSEDEDARKAADDLDEIAIGRRSGKPATRLKFDLDLPPQAIDMAPLDGGRLYPEWDYRRGSYLPDHCRVLTGKAAETGESWSPDAAMLRHVRHVRRRFEALRPQHEVMRGQADGFDLDIDALVRARCDLRAGSGSLDRVHLAMRPQRHDLAATLLVDVSLSTDAWVDGNRVLDVEKEALLESATLRRLRAMRSPQRSATESSIGRMRSPKRAGRSLASQTVNAVRRRPSSIRAMARRSSAVEATLMNTRSSSRASSQPSTFGSGAGRFTSDSTLVSSRRFTLSRHESC